MNENQQKKRAGRNIKLQISDELPEGVTEDEWRKIEEASDPELNKEEDNE